MKNFFIFFAILLLAACGSSVQPPSWQLKGSAYLEDYKLSFLSGKEGPAEPHFYKARNEISAGNDLNLLATVYLTKYALQTACLESFDAAEFARLQRLEPNPANMAYCHFLKGNFSAVDSQLLPSRYAGVLKASLARDSARAVREISSIADPLSRLVACGVCLRYLPPDENILNIAIKTSSDQGWRRPLWAYLEKLQTFYREKGDLGKAEATRLRLELLKK